MKKTVILLSILLTFLLIIYFKDDILSFLEEKFVVASKIEKNEWTRNYNFKYISNTDNLYPQNKQDILNIYYTFINSGMDEITFYCKRDYIGCSNDVKEIIQNQEIVSNINNFVHPYNESSGNHLDIYKNYGKIVIKNDKLYDNRMKYILEFDIDNIIEQNITKNMTDREKIKVIHDYIINHTKYDKEYADKKNSKHKANTAFGALEEGYAVCSGYADSMMLFLERFGIKNYKVASSDHVWNYVYLDNNWYHLDLTFDDPVTDTGEDIISYDYFLITDRELEKLDKTNHTYDKTIYTP